MADESQFVLRAGDYTLRELHTQLGTYSAESDVQLQVDRPLDGLGAGLENELSLTVHGDVGDFAFMLSQGAHYEVHGNAGISCGHSLASGSVLVHGSAGDYLAAFATGGFIAVHTHAAKKCGMELAGADVFVRRVVGDEAGYGMRDGALVLGNGAGENLGLNMSGGIIFVRGDVKSVATTARLSRMNPAEALRLSLLLARAGIKGNAADFRVFHAKKP